MNSPPSEDEIRKSMASLDEGELQKLWKLLELASSLDDVQLQEMQRLHRRKKLGPLLDVTTKAPEDIEFLAKDRIETEPVDDYVTEFETRKDIFDRVRNIASKSQSVINASLFAVIMVAPVDILLSRLQSLEDSDRRNSQTEIDEILSQWRTTTSDGIIIFASGGRQQRTPAASSAPSASAAASAANSVKNSPSNKPNPIKRAHDGSTSIEESSAKRRGHGRSASDSMSVTFREPPNLQPTSAGDIILSMQAPPIPQGYTNPQQPSTPRRPPAGESILSPKLYTRNPDAAKQCKRRDNNECCITCMVDPVAAHIFPFGVSKNAAISSITKMLEMFWGSNASARLSALIGNRNITESPQNLISLNRQLHWWMDECKMALKPLRKTENCVIVQFHWLNKSEYKPDTSVTNAHNDLLFRNSGIQNDQAWGQKLAHRVSGLRIRTGQVFYLRSTDPSQLPSFELLKLSWDLLRIAAMCGAAEEEGDSSDGEDNDDYYGDVEVYSPILDDGGFHVRQWMGAIDADVDENIEQHDNDISRPF